MSGGTVLAGHLDTFSAARPMLFCLIPLQTLAARPRRIYARRVHIAEYRPAVVLKQLTS